MNTLGDLDLAKTLALKNQRKKLLKKTCKAKEDKNDVAKNIVKKRRKRVLNQLNQNRSRRTPI